MPTTAVEGITNEPLKAGCFSHSSQLLPAESIIANSKKVTENVRELQLV